MIVFGSQIGATGLYLLFVWLISAAGGSWLSERKGYGDRVGLAFGLLLSAIGLVIVLLLLKEKVPLEPVVISMPASPPFSVVVPLKLYVPSALLY